MFADEHFKAEEKLLYACGYPALVERQNIHERCLESLTAFLVRATTGVFDKRGVNDFLQNWWKQHILEDDMAFKVFFQGRQIERSRRMS
jgi:hemerythrin-like metal-binding protein